MENYSPLRYPGGKSALYPAIANIIESNNMKHCIYIEPFAGGANIAWSLLINGIVDYSGDTNALLRSKSLRLLGRFWQRNHQPFGNLSG